MFNRGDRVLVNDKGLGCYFGESGIIVDFSSFDYPHKPYVKLDNYPKDIIFYEEELKLIEEKEMKSIEWI